ncbi:unnamed protein product [Arabis nemorensis]|uniref:Uncharacterized protein n=1 Tax=Arabis nemorensis TaxID=586526 RepID=A0A565ARX9_9BRAS|nr:unnamed protein product [Arabis nemorensis]
MPPRRPHDQQMAGEPVNDWGELRQTLLAMQENMQATIHDTVQEVMELFNPFVDLVVGMEEKI